MQDQNWENILAEKEENELLEIYSGHTHHDFETLIYAGLELKKRKFDFKKIEQIHQKNIEQLKSEINGYEKPNFLKSKDFKGILFIVLLVIIILTLILTNGKLIQNNYSKLIRIVGYIALALFPFITAIRRFNKGKRYKEFNIEKKIELLKKMMS